MRKKILVGLVVIIFVSFSIIKNENFQLYADNYKIIIDGDKSDWEGIPPLIEDPKGDTNEEVNNTTGADIKALYVTSDEKYLYMLLEVYNNFDKSLFRNYFVALDYNNDNDDEYHFGFRPDGTVWVFDHTQDKENWEPEWYPKGIIVAGGSNFIEVRISKEEYAIPPKIYIWSRITSTDLVDSTTEWKMFQFSTFPESKERIIIDGKKDDWENISPIVTDQKGDNNGVTGADIKAVYAIMDSQYLYVMYETYGSPIKGNYIFAIDNNNDRDWDYSLGFNENKAWMYNLLNLANGEWIGEKIIDFAEFSIHDVAEFKVPLLAIDNPKEVYLTPWIYVPSKGITVDETGRGKVLSSESTNTSSVAAQKMITIVCPEFNNTNIDMFQLNGSATLDGTRLQLTPPVGDKYGTAWWRHKIMLKDDCSFSVYFTFEISNSDSQGADGLTFTIQTEGIFAIQPQPITGSLGQGLGYYGISPSIAIEFDTYLTLPENDPNENHIGVDIDGSINHTGLPTAIPPFQLQDNGLIHVWIDYNGSSNKLEVRSSQTASRPASSLLDYYIDLKTIFGCSDVYIGFTAATGGSYSKHEIRSFYFNNDYIDDGITPDSVTYRQAQTILSINSNPCASVYVDGVYKGKTPLDLDIDPGNYTIELKKENYEPYTRTIELSPGETRVISATLDLKKAVLSINSTPNSLVYINDICKGNTPLNLELEKGEYEIKIEKENYKSYTESIELSPGESKSISVELDLKKAILSISSNPNASVYINNEPRGNTPFKIKLDPREYTIVIKKEKYESYMETIVLSPGEKKDVSITLRKALAYYQKYIFGAIVVFIFLFVILIYITRRKPKKSPKKQKLSLEKEQIKKQIKEKKKYIENYRKIMEQDPSKKTMAEKLIKRYEEEIRELKRKLKGGN